MDYDSIRFHPRQAPMAHDHWSYRDALRAIWDRSGYDRGYVSNPFWGDDAAKRGLQRTAALLDRLGRPQERYGILHVAGSKGKGSTCAFAASILRSAGYRVGRATSPHLHTFRERVAVDDEPVDEPTFAALTRRALRAAEALERDTPELEEVTAFELTTAMALDHMATAGCDLAVVEVGLGGTLDATNVVMPLVAAIAALDLEHTAVLGETLPEIAANKAGIIKPGRPVAVSPLPAEALAVVERVARQQGSPVIGGGTAWWVDGTWHRFAAEGPWGRFEDLQSGLAGDYQMENAGLAIAAVWLLGTTGFPVSEAAVRSGLAATRWPGRFEHLRSGATEVVLDGAHTPASAHALVASLATEYPGRRAVVVLGAMADKDVEAIARVLAPVTRDIIATAARGPRAAAPSAILQGAEKAGLVAVSRPSVTEALNEAVTVAGPNGLVVVTGSLAVVAEAREALGLARSDPPVDDAGSDR